jgi:hypothetical protein
MSQNANDRGWFVVIKTKLTTKRKRECKKKEIIYILSKASCLKAGQISLAFL